MNNEFQIPLIENTRCFCCDSINLKTMLDLGNQPLANNYHDGSIQTVFPLKLNLCTNCFHLQLSHTVNPDLMFKNYLYVSGTTNTLKEYFDNFAKTTLKYKPNAKKILDIACNDGTQLDSYKKLGLNTYGVDPATNLYKISVDKGHDVLCDYFNLESVKELEKHKFDIIVAQNVFAHNKYTVDFLQACKKVMDDDSFLFIQTSQADMVINNEFDTIYHEHLSFFNTNSMKILVERCGLVLSDVFKTSIHGNSYVFVITKKDLGLKGTEEMLSFEKEKGLYNLLTYPEYALKCYTSTFNLKYKLEELKKDNYLLVGYGAAAKGNTLLNFGEIDLDVIIDDNPLKQNLYTPGRDIKILSSSFLSNLNINQKVVFIPLAWNFFDEIKKRIKEKRNNSNDLFVKYFPNLIING